MSFGCLIVAVIFAAGLFVGLAGAMRRGLSLWYGVAFGVIAWLAVMSAYAVVLTIYDWRLAKKKPDLIGVPRWVPPLIWVVFAVATYAAVALYRRLHAA
jgi:hypothetical protein